MANSDSRDNKKKAKAGGGRTTALAGLLAVVALVALWLSDCIPGFGGGDAGGDADKAEQAKEAEKAEPAIPEPEAVPEPEAAEPGPIKITVDPRGCSVAGGEVVECAKLCDNPAVFEGRGSAIVDAKEGSHDDAIAALDCLKSLNMRAAVEREG